MMHAESAKHVIAESAKQKERKKSSKAIWSRRRRRCGAMRRARSSRRVPGARWWSSCTALRQRGSAASVPPTTCISLCGTGWWSRKTSHSLCLPKGTTSRCRYLRGTMCSCTRCSTRRDTSSRTTRPSSRGRTASRHALPHAIRARSATPKPGTTATLHGLGEMGRARLLLVLLRLRLA